MTSTGTETYYQRRASEYDKVYRKPERQADLQLLSRRLAAAFDGRDVLEVAAGTGYWTERYSSVARSVVATDVNDVTLDVARGRADWPESVEFKVANAFALDDLPGDFDSSFAGFFWSHLRLDQLDGFLAHLHRRLAPGAKVVLVDNRYVEGSNHPISRRDHSGNTYQQRKLEDGTSWEVLKNFPNRDELVARLDPIAVQLDIVELDYYWLAELHTRHHSEGPSGQDESKKG